MEGLRVRHPSIEPLLVVPALEDSPTSTGRRFDTPESFYDGLKSKELEPFQCRSFPPGHSSTQLPKLAQLREQGDMRPYRVKYTFGYEPYFVIRTAKTPRYAVHVLEFPARFLCTHGFLVCYR